MWFKRNRAKDHEDTAQKLTVCNNCDQDVSKKMKWIFSRSAGHRVNIYSAGHLLYEHWEFVPMLKKHARSFVLFIFNNGSYNNVIGLCTCTHFSLLVLGRGLTLILVTWLMQPIHAVFF